VGGCGDSSVSEGVTSPLKLIEVLYVPGLKKSLVSVSFIEGEEFEVLFKEGQLLMYPKGGSITSAKVIGVR